MANPVPISLGVRSNPARESKQSGNARLVNCFSEQVGQEGKSPWLITATPGLSNFYPADPPSWVLESGDVTDDLDIDFVNNRAWLRDAELDGGVREMIEVDGYLYVVAGRQLYRFNTSGEATLIGGIPTDGPVYARRNRRSPAQIAFVSDGLLYVWDTASLTQVSDPDLPPPTSLAYLDGYGVLPVSNGRYMLTSIDDFTAIDGLDEGTAEANPDPILRAHELGREVVFFGTKTLEFHGDSGDADFPFTRSQSVELGCLAADSVAPVGTLGAQTLVWVANDHTVRELVGYAGKVISSGEIEGLIQSLDEADRASELRATGWSWGGRFFYALSCADWTRVYDAKTGNWHERKSYLSERWRVSKVVSFAGKLIAGDATEGRLYQISDTVFAEGNEPHILSIISPPIHLYPYSAVGHALHIDVASGVGLNTTVPADLDPEMMVALSRDGGNTFYSSDTVSLGRLAQDAKRVTPFRQLGMFGPKGLTVRIEISAAVQKVVMSAAVEVERLAA